MSCPYCKYACSDPGFESPRLRWDAPKRECVVQCRACRAEGLFYMPTAKAAWKQWKTGVLTRVRRKP